jgi:hypothetical protein
MLLDEGTGLQELGRGVFTTLFAELNDQLVVEEERWVEADEELATLLERDYEPVTIEPIPTENWHLGMRMTLVEAPVESYPNICVMAYDARDAGDDAQLDHADVFNDLVFVEVMVKAETEALANDRCQRTADAVVKVLRRNRTLDGLVVEIPTRPRVVISDLFPRRSDAGAGDLWWWQGARIDYTVMKPAVY